MSEFDYNPNEDLDDEIISLQPVGTGFQNVEPGQGQSFSRPITPAFPVGKYRAYSDAIHP